MARKGGAPENMITLDKRSPEEQRAICSKGGKASGESKRRKKSMREWAKALGDEELVNSNGDKMSRTGIIILQQYNAALRGDLKAAKFIAQLLGELSDTDKAETLVNQTVTLKID